MGERDVHQALRETRRAMTEELMQRLRDGKITTRNLKSQRRSAFRGGKRYENALRRELRGVGDQGIKHVGDELERQRGEE